MKEQSTCLLEITGTEKMDSVEVLYLSPNPMIIVPSVMKVLIKKYSSDLLEANEIEMKTSEDAYNLPIEIIKETEERIFLGRNVTDEAMWSLVHQTFLASTMASFYKETINDFIEEYLLKDRDENILLISRLLLLAKNIGKIKSKSFSFFVLEFIHDSSGSNRIIEEFNKGNGVIQAYELNGDKIYDLHLLNSGYYLDQLKEQIISGV